MPDAVTQPLNETGFNAKNHRKMLSEKKAHIPLKNLARSWRNVSSWKELEARIAKLVATIDTSKVSFQALSKQPVTAMGAKLPEGELIVEVVEEATGMGSATTGTGGWAAAESGAPTCGEGDAKGVAEAELDASLAPLGRSAELDAAALADAELEAGVVNARLDRSGGPSDMAILVRCTIALCAPEGLYEVPFPPLKQQGD